jgi:pimeloyl-ACP methyl ester carboxylesterase
MAEDVSGLLKALGVDKAHLIGASLGGHIVQEFAINFPEMTESIVLMCTFAKSDHYLKSLAGFWLKAIEQVGHAQLCEEIMHWSYTRTYFETQKSRLDTARQKLKDLDASYNIKGFQWKVDAGITADTTGRLHKIKVPTLIMAGELDFFTSPSLSEQQLAKHIVGSRFEVIKGAAHAFFEEKSDEVNKSILSFLTGR